MSEESRKIRIPIQDELPALIRALRKPAGDDARFASRTRSSEARNNEHASAVLNFGFR